MATQRTAAGASVARRAGAAWRCGPRHGGAGVASSSPHPWPGQAGRRRSQMSAFTRHFAEENKVESPGPVSRVSAPHHAAAAHWHTAAGSHYCSTAHNIKVLRFFAPHIIAHNQTSSEQEGTTQVVGDDKKIYHRWHCTTLKYHYTNSL